MRRPINNKSRSNSTSAKRRPKPFSKDGFKGASHKSKGRSSSSKRGRRSRFGGPGIDLTKYINKGEEQVEETVYEPSISFSDFDIHPKIKKIIEERGYKQPTEIQEKSIPHILEGKDVVGLAGTGTGKTAAFLVPLIDQLIKYPHDQSVLVVTPTRELAKQISTEFYKLTKNLKLFSITLIGGENVYQSIKALRKKNHIVIGTPGRLLDMAKREALKLDKFKCLVLDEFDRMLDMGFKEDIKIINDNLRNKEQTLLFSATIEDNQKSLVRSMTNDAVEITAKNGQRSTDQIAQDIVKVPRGQDKFDILRDLVTKKGNDKVILFCETKRMVDDVCFRLKDSEIKADRIHGEKTQKAREVALKKLRQGHIQVLVATDVLARGIDISDISLVINYEVPRNYSDYLHRIGRTGRAGKSGKAITFV